MPIRPTVKNAAHIIPKTLRRADLRRTGPQARAPRPSEERPGLRASRSLRSPGGAGHPGARHEASSAPGRSRRPRRGSILISSRSGGPLGCSGWLQEPYRTPAASSRSSPDRFKATPYRVSITGHTSASKVPPKADYGPWNLSADRANAVRQILEEEGFTPATSTRWPAGRIPIRSFPRILTLRPIAG